MTGSSTVVGRVRERARWFLRMQKVEDRLQDIGRRVGQLERDDEGRQSFGEAHYETFLRARHADALAVSIPHLADEFAFALNRHELRIEYFERLALVEATTVWLRSTSVPPDFRVSVVLPTHNRAHLVPRAIASVVAQTYPNWEILLVDDGSTDDTPSVLGSYDDPRVRAIRTAGLGIAGARNTALDHATGDVVVYLDDDNLMHPEWLRAVAWAFATFPETDVLYGARLIDDEDRLHHRGGHSLPTMHFERFDRVRLRQGNIADMGVVAHRRGLAEARFDPDLTFHEDWDLFLRLTASTDPLQLPALAILYTTEADNRLTDVVDPEVHDARPPDGSSLAERLAPDAP